MARIWIDLDRRSGTDLDQQLAMQTLRARYAASRDAAVLDDAQSFRTWLSGRTARPGRSHANLGTARVLGVRP